VPPAAIFETPRFAELAMTVAKNVCERYGECGEFFVRKYGVARQEYVDYGILTEQEYDEWKLLLTNYPWNTRVHDCRTNWAPASELAEPHERIKTAEELAEEQRVREAMELSAQMAREERERVSAAALGRRTVTQSPETQRAQQLSQIDLRGLEFADDWSNLVIQHFVSRIRLLTYENLQMFGLSNNRGNVTYGYTVGGLERLPDTVGVWGGRFGVPYNVRMGQVSEDLTNVHISRIIDAAHTRRMTVVAVGPAGTEAEVEGTSR
jgi:hypothetical protein